MWGGLRHSPVPGQLWDPMHQRLHIWYRRGKWARKQGRVAQGEEGNWLLAYPQKHSPDIRAPWITATETWVLSSEDWPNFTQLSSWSLCTLPSNWPLGVTLSLCSLGVRVWEEIQPLLKSPSSPCRFSFCACILLPKGCVYTYVPKLKN